MPAEQERIEEYFREVQADGWRDDDAAFVSDVRSVLAELQAAQERERVLRELLHYAMRRTESRSDRQKFENALLNPAQRTEEPSV